MATIETVGTELRIETDQLSAAIALEGYTSGVKGGCLVDRRTGARDLGHGLDIADFLLEPADTRPQDPEHPYHYGDAAHGDIAKRYVELPQICTRAGALQHRTFRGDGFVAVRQWFRWTQATRGFVAGSLWEQTLVFADGQRYFYSADRITSANDSPALLFRLDLPGHLKHAHGAEFSSIYLSYEGKIPSGDFAHDFPPDARHLYRRDDAALPARMIRAYRVRLDAGDGPWLGGLTLDPADVYEAWCHQRGYVCFIQELGGQPIRAGERFGAAHAIGFFDSVEEMNEVYDRMRGHRGLQVEGDGDAAAWAWTAQP